MSNIIMYPNNPLISVIVPVYNVSKYVRRCVESVEHQTYQPLEIILVDDGSTDGSGEICDELENEFDNIRLFHTSNHGLSAARNFGMQHVSGEYVIFVDSDDAICPQHIDHLYSALREYDVHVAVTGYTEIEESHIPSEVEDSNSSPVFSLMEANKAINESVKLNGKFASHAWGKIYDKTIFPFLTFPEGLTFEDQYVAYKVFYQAGKIAYESANDYLYTVKRKASISENDSAGRRNFFRALEEELEFVKKKIPLSFDYVYVRYVMALMDAYVESVLSESVPDKKLWELIVTNRDNILDKEMKLKLSNRYALKYRLTFLGCAFFNLILKVI